MIKQAIALANGLLGLGRRGLLALTGAVLIAICLVFSFVMAAWHDDVILCLCVMGLSMALYTELGRRALAEAKLSRLADTDPLTGLANRRRFDAALAAEWSDAIEHAEPIAVLVVDVDAFKAFNDIYGHQAGDDALRLIARRLDSRVSDRDGLECRWGGEEFTLVLRRCDECGALAVADALCRAVQDLGLVHAGGIDRIVTISVGVASTLPATGGLPKDLLAIADSALYRAKAEGRDRSSARTRPRAAPPLDLPAEAAALAG